MITDNFKTFLEDFFRLKPLSILRLIIFIKRILGACIAAIFTTGIVPVITLSHTL